MKLLKEVARAGSFAEAARRLGMDPSHVSRNVARAEASLGLRLFERTTRQLRLTEAGGLYLARLGPVLEELAAAREAAVGLAQAPAGRLCLTTSVAFGQVCLLPHLADFRRLYPDLTLELQLSDRALDMVAEGVDLAFRMAPAPKGDLISTRLRRTHYRVCAAPEYLAAEGWPETPEALGQRDCLTYTQPGLSALWRFREGVVAVAGSVAISSPLALREAARMGLGPALLADWLVAEDLAAGRLVDLFPGREVTPTTFDTGIFALYPSRSYLPAKVRLALDFFRTRLR